MYVACMPAASQRRARMYVAVPKRALYMYVLLRKGDCPMCFFALVAFFRCPFFRVGEKIEKYERSSWVGPCGGAGSEPAGQRSIGGSERKSSACFGVDMRRLGTLFFGWFWQFGSFLIGRCGVFDARTGRR
jgi:hypothetical protein